MTKANQTKDHIIKTAARLFYENGINLTGINEIIKQSGIAKATLYAHFSSKDELIKAYIEHKDTELIASISQFLEGKAVGKKRILGVLEFVEEFYHSGSFNGCWCVRSIAEIPAANVALRKHVVESKKTFLKFLKQVVKENMPSASKSQLTSMTETIYLFYESAVAESHLHNEVWPINRNISLLRQYLKSVK